MRKIFLILILHTSAILAQGQKKGIEYPVAGKLCPDFVIKDVNYYSKKQVVPSDFRGKWLILDFYTKDCSSCIAAFPGYNRMQKQFSDRVQFILIGREDKQNQIRSVLSRFRKEQNLIMPCAFDSSVFHRLDINSSPYAIIIDPKGFVRYTVTFFEEKDLLEIIAGNSPKMRTAYREHEQKPEKTLYNSDLPFLTNGNGGNDTDFVYRSLLSLFHPVTQNRGYADNLTRLVDLGNKFHRYRYEARGISLNTLYRLAYLGDGGRYSYFDSLYGSVWANNILEVNDSSIFLPSSTDYIVTGNNVYNYSLSLPSVKFTKENLMQIMQSDLKNYFGYDVIIETRKMPCWRLVATNEAKMNLKTKGGVFKEPTSTYHHEYPDSLEFKNFPSYQLLPHLIPTSVFTAPFFDETGITGNIDITVHTKVNLVQEIDAIKEYLQKSGLDLIKGVKEMKVLVIKDPKNNK